MASPGEATGKGPGATRNAAATRPLATEMSTCAAAHRREALLAVLLHISARLTFPPTSTNG
jgi:hypothetical protein